MAVTLTRFALLAAALCLVGAERSSQLPGMRDPTKIGPFRIPNIWAGDKHPEDHPLNPIHILEPSDEARGVDHWEEQKSEWDPAYDLDSTATESVMAAEETGTEMATAATKSQGILTKTSSSSGSGSTFKLVSHLFSAVGHMIGSILYGLRWILAAPFKLVGGIGHMILPAESSNSVASASDKVINPTPEESTSTMRNQAAYSREDAEGYDPAMWDKFRYDPNSAFLQTDAAKRASPVTGARKRGNLGH